MNNIYKRMTDFLIGIGIEDIPHTHKTYLGHLIAVYRMMQLEGCTEEVCQAGMFHSVYGTERFQGFKLPLERRDEVRSLIGDRAERLAYINCAMDRASLDRALAQPTGPYKILDRLTGQEIVLVHGRPGRSVPGPLLRLHGTGAAHPRVELSPPRLPAHGRTDRQQGHRNV